MRSQHERIRIGSSSVQRLWPVAGGMRRDRVGSRACTAVVGGVGSRQWGSRQWGSRQWGSRQWGSRQWGSRQWGSDRVGSRWWGSDRVGSRWWGSDRLGSRWLDLRWLGSRWLGSRWLHLGNLKQVVAVRHKSISLLLDKHSRDV